MSKHSIKKGNTEELVLDTLAIIGFFTVFYYVMYFLLEFRGLN